MQRKHSTAVAVVSALLVAVSASAVAAQVPSPSLEGPVTGGSGAPFIASTFFDLARVNYTQEEFFISGTATAYSNDGPFMSDGIWPVVPSVSAAYKTRILVYRPLNPRKFNGTVIVEWLNVSGGLDAAPDWLSMHTELIRRGFAWAGVSAQYIGVEGGVSIVGLPVMPLKKTDQARYGSLVHPGDSFSYDIFSQAGQAILHPAGTSPLGPLQPRTLIAAGESQSAFRLVTYINAVHPLAAIYDGFFVARIRTDLDGPVLTFQTETDLVFLGSFHDRQPDSDRFRLWEVAGTAHADAYMLVTAFNDLGRSPAAADLVVTKDPIPGLISCGAPVNSGPQHFVLKAAIVALDRWIKDGTPPPSAPRLDVAAGVPPVIARDEHGNALGGIRTPQMDVPIAKLAGDGQVGSILCLLLGTTTPFDDAKLAALYPTHDAYVSAFSAATRRALTAGFIGSRDARLMRQAAALSDTGR
jgi:hypothetical protein